MLDPLNHPPDKRDVTVEVARRMTDNGVKLRPGSGIGRQVATYADHAVAVDRPITFLAECDRPATIKTRVM